MTKAMTALVIVALGTLLGCAATPSADKIVYVSLTTAPSGALVTFEGGETCTTPCVIGVIESVPLTIGRIGYEAVPMELTPDSPRQLSVDLKRVVEDDSFTIESLPDL
ncbi:hypothetical protein PB2503_11864 [Parvularcula bermudensis HTCC2503]|uniref:PEGA domain-containing protein n=1 Tax=Parvularcula bermudensis (strain ATCC BAA-594 / HTCC2503 / KCTC 12087) TaxID=314260 RepID=E0TDW8_PARBH|nr:PEGA domain-containing protein [Parvularcula bermudensis]ADM10417.1 hypothetical protein PB2503_11864 [Parvularcula bermudensis HTCC2503]